MKHSINYTVALLLFTLLASCSETFDSSIDISEQRRMLSVSQTSFSFTADRQVKHFDVTSINIPWRIENSASWLDFSPNSDIISANISASVDENTTDTARVSRVQLSSTDHKIPRTYDLTFSQSAYAPYIHFSQNELVLTADASSASVTVESNREWSFLSSASWLTVSRASNRLTISATLNDETRAREAYVVVTVGSLTQQIHVTQRAAVVSSEQKVVEFGNNAESKTITISSDAMWTTECSQSWIQVSPDKGNASDAAQLNISVTDNTNTEVRTGYIYISVGSTRQLEIEVSQEASTLSATPTELTFDANSSSFKLNITSNTRWSVAANDASWLHFDKSSGTGDGRVTVSVDSNNGNQRSNSIVLENALSGAVVQNINVIQKAAGFSASPTQLYFDFEGGTKKLYIDTSLPWMFVLSDDWISVSSVSGQGYAEIDVTVSANPSTNTRSGNIILMNTATNTILATIPVTQAELQLEEYEVSLEHTFLSKGESLKMTSYETEPWTAEVTSGNNWISLSPTSGNSNQELTITVADNPSGEPRAGGIKVAYGYHIYYCPIIQAGKTIAISTSNVDFFAKGGESQSIVITADKTANVSCDVSWLSIRQNGNTFTIVATPNTSSEMRTGKVTVSLSGVSNLEPVVVTVRQAGIDATFSGIGFDDDEDWNGNHHDDGNLENKTFTVNGVSFDMIAVEGGTFIMGATAEQGSDAFFDEKPPHQVTLSSYYIGKTEVTQELWQAVMGSNPSDFKGDKKPVERVSWNDCQEFITKLNSLTGQKFRLPTEAEWEYAARGGNNSKGYKYSGSNDIDDVAWHTENSNSTTHDVGQKVPNELGIYDMSGNVWEWCQDWYEEYSSSAQTNPIGPNSGSSRVLRGGSWDDDASYCRSSCRIDCNPDSRNFYFGINYLGLRLALSE